MCFLSFFINNNNLNHYSFFSKKAGTLQTAFKNEHVHLNGDVDLDMAAPQLHGAGVIK